MRGGVECGAREGRGRGACEGRESARGGTKGGRSRLPLLPVPARSPGNPRARTSGRRAHGSRYVLGPVGGVFPSGPRPVRLSKSATKARIPPGRWKKNVDIPGFSPRSMMSRSSFVAVLDTLLPGAVPHVPCVSVSLSHRKDPGAGRKRREGARRCRGRVRGVGAVPPGSDVRYRGDPGGAAHSIGVGRQGIGGIMRKRLSAQRC